MILVERNRNPKLGYPSITKEVSEKRGNWILNHFFFSRMRSSWNFIDTELGVDRNPIKFKALVFGRERKK